MYFLQNTSFQYNLLLLVVSLNELVICLVIHFFPSILAVKKLIFKSLFGVIIVQPSLEECVTYCLFFLNAAWASIPYSDGHTSDLRSLLDNTGLCTETMSFQAIFSSFVVVTWVLNMCI